MGIVKITITFDLTTEEYKKYLDHWKKLGAPIKFEDYLENAIKDRFQKAKNIKITKSIKG